MMYAEWQRMHLENLCIHCRTYPLFSVPVCAMYYYIFNSPVTSLTSLERTADLQKGKTYSQEHFINFSF
jgi:hypothetical protein